ncbi:polyhydroxyalkanoate synthesis repressor PhaR [Novosphingobium sp. FSY-8]|uniref:Polyhydroxyalkanoate synthesis repressor PhaR n=1 Tax=Novosphingobium ovatum TaxID=1908523 RepID=A0ABW9XCJ5_9SPHN|nr:polyhydroxyalkanoate synthesis repressor PhaR [Novosphingobium ovatum]NBC36267.1 polyhydroxyalkanoate synthesis repressor PhaR [Novosphingobium ovatum]
MTEAGAKDNTVIIKKYANRRLYNTQSSSYITLDHLAKMTREGIDFRVLDAKSGNDITHQILTQIIMEEEASGEQMLPVNFLRQLIGMYGNQMQSLVPHYLEASMDQFRANQMKLRKAFEDSMETNPLARLAQQNIAMFQAAAAAFMPGAEGVAKGMDNPADAAPTAEAPKDDLNALRAQMAEMQKKLDQLVK